MALVGDLRDFALVEVLQILSMGKRTGELRITTSSGADGGAGAIGLLRGRVCHAESNGCEPGEAAFFNLMGLQEGRFSFEGAEPAEVEWPATVKRSLESLLMEAASEERDA